MQFVSEKSLYVLISRRDLFYERRKYERKANTRERRLEKCDLIYNEEVYLA